ncbi:Uncharacterized protein SCF082_LOCUS13538 [Durusdinium trenchii]|uniref:Uncharacterized protein n=2 Tax=Durusdinium trenchii TaxID=1381693 RepID=A0ABP0JRZ4_9DINO
MAMLATWAFCLLTCSLAVREELVVDSVDARRATAAQLRTVPVQVNVALRKAKGRVARHVIVLKEHLRELAAKKNAAEEAKRKKKKTLEAIESHTAAFGRHAARTRESLAALEEALASHDEKGLQLKKAKDQWKDLDGQVQVLEGELTKAKERAEAKMEEMTEQLQAQEAQVEKVKAERDEAEKAMEEKDLELQKAKTWRGQMLEAHDKAEAEMHAARKALDDHQKQLDNAVSAVEAAAANAAAAQRQAKLLEVEHGTEKKSLEMLLMVREAIQAFYKKLDALTQSMEEEDESETSAPERMKEDSNLKPALESYNEMVQSFHQLYSFNTDLYSTVKPAVVQIKHNAFSAILLECDPGEKLEKEAEKSNDYHTLQETCGAGLWASVGVQRLRFPLPNSAKLDEWWDHNDADEESELLSDELPTAQQ